MTAETPTPEYLDSLAERLDPLVELEVDEPLLSEIATALRQAAQVVREFNEARYFIEGNSGWRGAPDA